MKETVFSEVRLRKGIHNLLIILTKFLSGLLVRALYQVKREGLEQLPKGSAFVLLPKHQRWLDIPLIGWATPRPLYYMAKYELFLNPLVGWYLAAIGGIPINRAKPLASRRSLLRMFVHLNHGAGIVIFPEGTYYNNHLGRGRAGLIKMIRARLPVPFIPVGIRYAERKGRGLVKIKFGKPMLPEAGLTTELFLENIMKEIAILSEL
jgi:1-acyl-sn-glycerol-3-phosphate acyltransferase